MNLDKVAEKLIFSAYGKGDYFTKPMTLNNPTDNTNPAMGFLEYLAEGVLVVDEQRVICSVNRSLERMLGWTPEELIGQQCLDIFDCLDLESAAPLCQNLCPLVALQGKKTVHYQEVSMITKSGQRRQVSSSFAPLDLPYLENGEKKASYSIILLRDITDQSRQERIKTQFMATASHQLRTPLASIKTSIGLLLDSVGENFSDPLMRLLQNIQQSSLRMERLVNDLIELTNLQSGRIQMQRRQIVVDEIIKRAAEMNQVRLESKKQTLRQVLPALPLNIETDYLRISQVLAHLIANASKFSPTGSEIVVKVIEDSNNNVIFSIIDTGIGISVEDQSLIFEKFYQSLVSENSNEIGSGLGLPLARAIIELNSGRLWFESEPGKGSSFHFALPALQSY
jgi:NtrC-family two-component system sensor histidine kinase KinB